MEFVQPDALYTVLPCFYNQLAIECVDDFADNQERPAIKGLENDIQRQSAPEQYQQVVGINGCHLPNTAGIGTHILWAWRVFCQKCAKVLMDQKVAGQNSWHAILQHFYQKDYPDIFDRPVLLRYRP